MTCKSAMIGLSRSVLTLPHVQGRHSRVVASNEVDQLLGDLLANCLILRSFLRCEQPVTRDAFYGYCLLGTSQATAVIIGLCGIITQRCRLLRARSVSDGAGQDRLTRR